MKSPFSYDFPYDFSYGGHHIVAVSLNLLRPSRPATRLRKVPQARRGPHRSQRPFWDSGPPYEWLRVMAMAISEIIILIHNH